MKIKILIADDNSFIREGMKIILSTYRDFEVLAKVDDVGIGECQVFLMLFDDLIK